MNINSQATQVSSQSEMTQTAQVFTLNKAKSAQANAVLPLLDSAVQSVEQIRASNPANLGQNIDVTA